MILARLLRAAVVLPFLCMGESAFGQFNVTLLPDYAAAEQTLEIFNGSPVNVEAAAALRGNRIAAATAGFIAGKPAGPSLLVHYLDSLRYGETIAADIYGLADARSHAAEIGALLDEMRRRNFGMRVAATVAQIFPPDAAVNVAIPIYVAALGHENVDAFVRRIVWHGDEPEFVGENQGELTIVLNLGKSVDYGSTTDERFIAVLGVVAHELFHAAFGAYKESSPVWKEYYAVNRSPFDALIDITQNEGIAYYLSLDQRGRGYLPRDWNVRTRDVFDRFNAAAAELLSPRTRPERLAELLKEANLAGYWESYGAMAGMVMAREIDLRLGRPALIETISRTPDDMLRKYMLLTDQDSNLPRLSPRVRNAIVPQ